MKITFYADGRALNTYTRVELLEKDGSLVTFIGTDEWDNRVKLTSTMPFIATHDCTDGAVRAAMELRESIKGTCGACKG